MPVFYRVSCVNTAIENGGTEHDALSKKLLREETCGKIKLAFQNEIG